MKIDFIAAHPSNYYQGRGGNSIQYIVVHYTANNGDTAAGNGSYFSGANRQASAHYFVDERSVVQTVKDGNAAWHCGGGLQGSGGHAWHGKCTNRNSLGIEMCSDKVGGKYVITAATVDRTLELVRYLMRRYSVPASRVIRHYDVTGKICPEPWVRNPALWQDFKNRLEDEDMTQEQFNVMYDKVNPMYRSLDAVPEYWRAETKALMDCGAIGGDDKTPLAIRREELQSAVIAYRAVRAMKE